jgi:hypothetical protein
MTTPDSKSRFALYFRRNFFDAPTCAGLVAELRAARGEAGTLVAFRAETTREVTPVTHGERYSIISLHK